jgi:hypothetical protein
MPLTVIPVTMPRSLEGVQNGKLPASLLVEVGLRGRLHELAARAWNALRAEGATKGWHLTYTFGGCYRTYEEQRTLFLQRYQMEPIAGRPTKVWEGVVWYQRPATAMAAVPGTSNHGLGLAVDAALDNDLSDGVGPDDATSIGPAMAWFHDAALRYGFSFEAQSEPWHIRYVTGDNIPAAVLAHEGPPPEEGDDDMAAYIAVPPTERKGQPWLFVSSGVRPATTFDIEDNVPRREMDDIPAEYRVQQYDFLKQAAGL